MNEGGDPPATKAHPSGQSAAPPSVRRFRLSVVEGPARGQTWDSVGPTCSLGSHESNDLVLADPTVSRFHSEIALAADAAHVRDLGSTNGTILDGVPVIDGLLRGDSLVRMGASVVRFQFQAEQNRLPVSVATRFGTLTGASVAMRTTFAMLERAAASNATVLLEGETGTGKGQAALSLHRASARKAGPFVTVDCGAIPPNLLESRLFGHERGAFTGAVQRRIGAFEAASGGTIFLDELGELPADLQPKLLRALEEREVRRVGATQAIPVDVRVVAATNRELRAEVNAGRFRPNLYFRLAVVRITLPALRQRPEDLPVLVDALLTSLDADPELAAPLRAPEFVAQLGRGTWPGNVRELRNHLERCLVMQDAVPVDEGEAPPSVARGGGAGGGGGGGVDSSLPFAEARDRAMAAFEREYLAGLIAAHGDRTVRAAASAGIGRVYLYKLLKKHGLR